jgi:hypothetical protein
MEFVMKGSVLAGVLLVLLGVSAFASEMHIPLLPILGAATIAGECCCR